MKEADLNFISSVTKGKSVAKSPGKTPRKSTGKPTTQAAARPKPEVKAAPARPAADVEVAAEPKQPPAAPAKDAAKTKVPTKAVPTDHATPAPNPSTSKTAPRRAGIMLPILGGILAAGIGAAAVLYLLPQGWNSNSDALDAQAVQITALQGGLDAMRAEIPGDRAATIASLQDDVASLSASLDDVRAQVASASEDSTASRAAVADQLAGIQSTQDTLTGRIGALEARPVDQAPDIAALQADVRALTERLETAAQEARDQIAAANTRAAEVEELAIAGAANQAARSALAALSDTVTSGRPFADALASFRSAAPDAEIAPILSDNAETGLASLPALRSDFPDAARAALATVATAPSEDGSLTGRMTAFLRAQTGARSLSPREGDDPDAILSRAEAALAEGDLPETVRELDALPADASAPMQDWIARARTRLDVLTALSDLSAPNSSN